MALPGSQRTSAIGRRGSEPPLRADPTAAAVADLYRACHLRPPAVLVARDAIHFGRLVGRVLRSSNPMTVLCGIQLGMLLLNVLAASAGDAFGAAYGAFVAVLLVPSMLAFGQAHRGTGAVFGAVLLRTSVSLLLGAAAVGLAWLAGADRQGGFQAASVAMGAGACVQLALALLAPRFARWRLGRTVRVDGEPLSWAAVLWGAARADAVVAARLASALHDVEVARGPDLTGGLRGDRGQAQWTMQSAITTEAHNLGIGEPRRVCRRLQTLRG